MSACVCFCLCVFVICVECGLLNFFNKTYYCSSFVDQKDQSDYHFLKGNSHIHNSRYDSCPHLCTCSSQARIAKLSRTLPSSNEDLSHEVNAFLCLSTQSNSTRMHAQQMRKKRSVSTLPDHEDNLERASTPPKKAPFPRV